MSFERSPCSFIQPTSRTKKNISSQGPMKGSLKPPMRLKTPQNAYAPRALFEDDNATFINHSLTLTFRKLRKEIMSCQINQLKLAFGVDPRVASFLWVRLWTGGFHFFKCLLDGWMDEWINGLLPSYSYFLQITQMRKMTQTEKLCSTNLFTWLNHSIVHVQEHLELSSRLVSYFFHVFAQKPSNLSIQMKWKPTGTQIPVCEYLQGPYS